MELGILVGFMIVTGIVMIGLAVIFRGWMQRRAEIDEARRRQH